MHAPPCQNQNPHPHVQSNCQHHTHDMTMETQTNDMMASPTSPPSFTCQSTCFFHNPPIARPDPPSRRRKRGREGPSSPFRIVVSSASAGPDHRPLHPWTPPYPEWGGSGPASRPPRCPSFARQLRQLLGGPVHLGLSARGPNFGALQLDRGWEGPRMLVAAGFGVGEAGCWGAASAGDVVVAPFSLIPFSFQVEDAHSQCQAH